ncbi:MAG: oxidoreductase [Gemmatimonadetes bacterium]|nr:oxidoreductase [Gemmatimonadota bacterium]
MPDLKFAFAGFGHTHINSLYKLVQERDGLTVIGACESEAPSRDSASKAGIDLTQHTLDEMLDAVDCDVVAIGAAFGDRGAIAIEALKQGKHVIADKPLCTRMSELDEITQLSADAELRVGCMLTQRGSRTSLGLRHLIQQGKIGDLHAINFGGQHPLNLGSRPAWYFEPDRHGGTITDIFIHAADSIPWMTGLAYDRVVAARCWNALAPDYPHFEDGAQLMVTLENGCGIVGDVSYFMPSEGGYKMPYYWRTTFFGSEAVAEISAISGTIDLTVDGEVVSLDPEGPPPRNYLDGFIADIAGESDPENLSTHDVLQATRTAIRVQEAADTSRFDVSLA